jgi:hypothetical protein
LRQVVQELEIDGTAFCLVARKAMSRTTPLAGLAVGAVALCAAAPGAFAGPSMSTNFTTTTMEQRECVQRAERVIRGAGLQKNFEIVGQSVFGERDAYTAQIRCITDKGVVIFVIAGPKLEEAREHMRAIFDKF